jgi:hypothetical protein
VGAVSEIDTLLAGYAAEKGYTLASNGSRSARSPLTRYIEAHWDELGPSAGACVVPTSEVTAKNPRQGLRQSVVGLVRRRYGVEILVADVRLHRMLRGTEPVYVLGAQWTP